MAKFGSRARFRTLLEKSSAGSSPVSRTLINMFKSTGQLRYSRKEDNFWLVLDIDKQIADYYRSFIPKQYIYNLPRYLPHISIVRKEKPLNIDVWGKYNGEDTDFYYDGYVYIGNLYCWIDAFSDKLEKIREELGLPVHSTITMPPEGFKRNFHITLVNFKSSDQCIR